MEPPFFSIVIPTYNRAEYINKAVQSLLSQTFSDFEIIIIDDASTDDTEDIIQSYDDKRIVYIKNAANKERCISRNRGIEKANGKYICFLDSDDYHLPNHLEKLYQLISSKNEPEAFFFSNAWDEDMTGNRAERACPDFEKFNAYTYYLHYTVNPQRWAVHHKVFEKIKFDPEIIICEDMDTSLRILAAGYPVYQLKELTTVYVAAEDSFTHSDTNKAEKELLYLKKIFAKKELRGKLPIIERWRLLSMCHYHLAIKAFKSNSRYDTLKHALKSFLFYPKGYNGKTNKTLLVMSIYAMPLFGKIVKFIISKLN